jgi:internalin A
MPRDQVFISYSHKDEGWLTSLEMHLNPYLRDVSITRWSDKQIRLGSQWISEINSALNNTKVAVLLVTPAFLASNFIDEHELGPLLKDAERGGITIVWVPVCASSYKRSALEKYQAVLNPETPLAGMTKAKRDQAWVTICEAIEKAVSPPKEPFPEDSPSMKFSPSQLGSSAYSSPGAPRSQVHHYGQNRFWKARDHL